MLRVLTAHTRWTWITGNHDAGLVDRCGGAVVREAELDGLILRHEADPVDPRPELSGHFHPKLRVSLRGRQVARRCFVASATKLILPAFGTLTGGSTPVTPKSSAPWGGTRRRSCLWPIACCAFRWPPDRSGPIAQDWRVGRMTISFTSTSSGCSMA